jgi:hypothetical protein
MRSFHSSRRFALLLAIRSASLCLLMSAGGLVPPATALDYKRDILPIFKDKCFDCHEGSNGKNVKGGLRLDDPAHFLRRFAKNDVIVPGDWDASYLFVTITRERGGKGAMPPKGKGEPLRPDEIMTVARWIHEGARIEGERGEPGPDDFDPEKLLKFKDGVIVRERLGSDSGGAPAKDKPAAQQREWVNSDGRKIKAAFGGLEGDTVILLRDDGKTFKYPLAKLSEQSRKDINELESQPAE